MRTRRKRRREKVLQPGCWIGRNCGLLQSRDKKLITRTRRENPFFATISTFPFGCSRKLDSRKQELLFPLFSMISRRKANRCLTVSRATLKGLHNSCSGREGIISRESRRVVSTILCGVLEKTFRPRNAVPLKKIRSRGATWRLSFRSQYVVLFSSRWQNSSPPRSSSSRRPSFFATKRRITTRLLTAESFWRRSNRVFVAIRELLSQFARGILLLASR